MRGKRCDGDCLNCPLPDCEVDQTRGEYITAYIMRRYRIRKEAGLCTQCGKALPLEGRLKCAGCTAASADRQAAYYRRSQARGLCAACGKAPARPGRTRCAECAAKDLAHRKERAERLAAAGVCTACGKAPARPGMRMCAECSGRQNERNKARKKEQGNG